MHLRFSVAIFSFCTSRGRGSLPTGELWGFAACSFFGAWSLVFGVSGWNFTETVENLNAPQLTDSFLMKAIDALRSAMAEVDAYYKERGIFQDKFGFGKRPALVVIDMAYGWTDPAYAGGSSRLDTAIEAIRQMLPLARSKRVPIYYTTSVFHKSP